ncbi:MAG: transporter substrate-binding domain-containing protein [Firmicutes bacterium]|nr:transporter substrate-binding domain-containing protein [Bacillota bacterium]
MKKFFGKMKTIKKGVALYLAMVCGIAFLSGCGNTAKEKAATNDNTQNATTKGVTKVKFASGTINWPFCFMDENGELSGFEYDLAREVDKVLDQYEFEIVGSEWEDMLTSVKLGKIDIAAWTIKRSPEREENFLFSDEVETVQKFYLTVGANNNDIKSLEDLQDATVDGSSTEEYIYKFWEKYSKEHPEQNINIIASGNCFSDAGIEALQNGSTTALFMDDISVAGQIEKRGKVLKVVGEPLAEEYGYYVYNKDNTELKEAVDGALKELKENGVYDRLYDKWFSFVDESLETK